ncbi:MAG: DUF58 domain-containing protein [Bryobacteraceae bacterium]
MKLRELWRRQRITAAGGAFLLTIVLVAGAAFISANNLLFLILAAMVATFLISGFVGRLGLAGLELDLLLPQHTSARRKVMAAVRIRNVKRLASFSIHLAFSRQPDGPLVPAIYFPLIPGGATAEEPMELYFPHRGAHKQRDFQFFTRFPFGFVERSEDVAIRHEVIVYPCLDPRPEFEQLLQSVSAEIATLERGQGSDFYRIRPYEASESARHVDWKATAHTGALQVREFAREQDRTVVVCLDLDIPSGAEAWLEAAIECSAFLAFELAGRGARVRFLTQGLDVTVPDVADIYTILKYLALVSPLKGIPPVGPLAKDFHIIFTQNPRNFALGEFGHEGSNVRLLGSDFA